MRSAVLLSCLVLSWVWHEPLQAETGALAAVIADPEADKQSPLYLAGLTITSHGVQMDAILYLAQWSEAARHRAPAAQIAGI